MRTTLIAALAAIVWAAAPTSAQSALEEIIRQHERDWAQAVATKERARLEELLDPRFRLVVVERPGVTDRARYLSEQGDPDRAYDLMTLGEIDVTLIGDVAIADFNVDIVWPEGAGDRPGAWRYTDVWGFSDGEWRAMGRYSQPR